MNRFVPDTLRDALWRPVAMAMPDAGLYIEIMAPDFRFAALLLLMAATAVFALRKRGAPGASPLWLLIAFTWLAFIPWLATTGNGRYFIAVLLLAGPLCVGLIHRLPMTAAFRLSAAVIVIGVQVFALVQNNPWGRWPLAPWSQPYVDLQLDDEERNRPATYVTVTSISYSLIAPMFDARSRWLNVASLTGDPQRSIDDRRAQLFLQKASAEKLPFRLVAPTVPVYMTAQGQPTEPMRNELNRLLSMHALGLVAGQPCKVARSRTIAALAMGELDKAPPERVARFGFWICELQYPVPRPEKPPPAPEDANVALVFGKLEQGCPRLFPQGEGIGIRFAEGFSRSYSSSDIKLYVLDNGEVLYKYWRGLNPGRVGSVAQVLADGFRMDCNTIRGRSGLPWERQL